MRQRRRPAAQCAPPSPDTTMNEIFLMLGIESWKPVLTALLLPPVPMLPLVLLGARLMFWRRAVGWTLILLATCLLWFAACSAVGNYLNSAYMAPLRALSSEQVREMRRAVESNRSSVAVVVLGAGREANAPEYGTASLKPLTLERLRYGLWLGRETGAPVAYSGGTGHGAAPGISEAEVAAEVAAREFGRPLRWAEKNSRDTRENAIYTTGLLRQQGVQQLVLVTHGFHMPRALRAFRDAAERAGAPWQIVPAPMGLARGDDRAVMAWMPTNHGLDLVRLVIRERLGYWFGA
jgi:uncharacterized SAM-binding protein YcdF (DUF218 family)